MEMPSIFLESPLRLTEGTICRVYGNIGSNPFKVWGREYSRFVIKARSCT